MSDPVLTPELLLQGYASGVFPMAEARDDPEVFWVDPKKRGIMPLDGFHLSRSLARRLRKPDYRISLNDDFEGVVSACADREETWINDTIFDLYRQLHIRKHAHSLEVWQGDDLVGGVYGVSLGAAFFGESMFSRIADASKIALAYLVERLHQTGFELFDAQFITSHLASLGAIEIPRASYHKRLAKPLEERADLLSPIPLPSAQDVIQRNTQIS